MERESSIGTIDKTDIIINEAGEQKPDALTIAVAHNRVVKGKIQGGQPDAESIKTLVKLVADAPDHVIKTLYPEI